MAKRKSTIDLDKVQSELNRWNRTDMDRWELRQKRFQRDQELYQLATPEHVTARNPADIIIANDPRVTTKKFARLIARHPNLIDIPPAPGVAAEPAQVMENWLYLYDQSINQNWMLGLHHPYRYDQAFFACLRGWQTLRTMLRADEDDDLPEHDPMRLFDHQIFDPVNVYPYAAGGKVRRVTHAYTATIAELYDDPFYAKNLEKEWGTLDDPISPINEKASVTVHATYWLDGENSWQHAVVVTSGKAKNTDSVWIKEPTELGYNPWTIVIGNGSSYQRTPWSDLDYLEEMGAGVLDDNAEMYKYQNRMITRLNELLSLEVNPPVTVSLQDGKVKVVNFYPGSRNFITPRDKLEVHKFGPQIGDFQLLWDILSQRIARATIPPAFFAEYGGESGFSASVLLAAGKDILFPFTEAINAADSLKYRLALELYRDFGPSKPLMSKIRPDGFGRVLSAELTREMIKQQGVYVDVSREDMTPQELVQRIQVGLAQVKEKAISLETFRKEYAKLKNPYAENIKVLAEHVYLSDDVIKALIPQALSETGQEQLRRVWELTQNPLPPPEGAVPGQPGVGAPGMPPGPPGLPPGMPPGPPGMMPPGGPPGMPPMPPNAMPPIAANPMLGQQPAQFLDPATMQMLAQNPMLAALGPLALGGAGAGGVPPVPGQPNVLALPPLGG